MQKRNLLMGITLALSLVTVILLLVGSRLPPLLLGEPREARQAVEQLFRAYGEDDGSTEAGRSLGLQKQPQSPAAEMLWQAYRQQLTYEIGSPVKAWEGGVSFPVTLTYPDLQELLQRIGPACKRQLRKAPENTDAILQKELKLALKQGTKQITKQLTVQVARQGNGWQVLPDQALLEILSGGFSAE